MRPRGRLASGNWLVWPDPRARAFSRGSRHQDQSSSVFPLVVWMGVGKMGDDTDCNAEGTGPGSGVLMARPKESARFRWLSLVLLGGMVAAWPATVLAQEGGPLPPLAVPVTSVPPRGRHTQQLCERLGKVEQRLDWLTRQNEALLRENKVLMEKSAAPFPNGSNPDPGGVTSGPLTVTAGATASEKAGGGALGLSAIEAQSGPQG